MTGKLLREIRQSRPLTPAEEAFLNVQRTAEVLWSGLADTLKPFDISPTQYNVLRILRGAGRDGLSCNEISGRLVNRVPDVTRLLDRLERRKVVRRRRHANDRRIIVATITPAGLDLLSRVDGPVTQYVEDRFRGLNRSDSRSLTGLLERIQEPA